MSSDDQIISKSVLLINRIYLPTPISNISKYYDIPSGLPRIATGCRQETTR